MFPNAYKCFSGFECSPNQRDSDDPQMIPRCSPMLANAHRYSPMLADAFRCLQAILGCLADWVQWRISGVLDQLGAPDPGGRF